MSTLNLNNNKKIVLYDNNGENNYLDFPTQYVYMQTDFKESYFKKVGKELKLVKWPTAKDVLKYTISTIVFCIILCALFMALNLILSVVKGWFA